MARLLAVGHVGLTARDLSRAARFYREVIGFRPVAYHEGVIAILAIGDTQTDLFLMPGEQRDSEIDLISDDVDAMRAQLVARGIRPHSARHAALFALSAEVPHMILAQTLGISQTAATTWAALAARDWGNYIAQRQE